MYPTIPIKQAIADLKQGKMLIVVDDASRENQADLIFPAQTATEEHVNFLLQHCRGMICVPLTRDHARRLYLPLMVDPIDNTETTGVNFTVTVDARSVRDFGISARDRAKTITALADPSTVPDDLIRPGHVFPLLCTYGGLGERQGHTEAAVTLCRLAGYTPCGVLCEILDDTGRVSTGENLIRFAGKHRIGIITIPDLIAYTTSHSLPSQLSDSSVIHTARATLPSRYGTFTLIIYRSVIDDREHAALLYGEATDRPMLTRIHSQCLTGDTFHSLRCDCGEQLEESMRLIAEKKSGVIIYLNQEGRGIGLTNKIRAYALQDSGMDTVEANHALGFPSDARDYAAAADILCDLGIAAIILLTNNPEKLKQLEQHGISVAGHHPLEIAPNSTNRDYLKTKKEKLGHLLEHV